MRWPISSSIRDGLGCLIHLIGSFYVACGYMYVYVRVGDFIDGSLETSEGRCD